MKPESQNVGNCEEVPTDLDKLLKWCDWAQSESERIKRRMKRETEGLKRLIDEFKVQSRSQNNERM